VYQFARSLISNLREIPIIPLQGTDKQLGAVGQFHHHRFEGLGRDGGDASRRAVALVCGCVDRGSRCLYGVGGMLMTIVFAMLMYMILAII